MSASKIAWVTGARGFIGSHLALHLRARGHEVYGIGHGQLPAESWPRAGLTAWSNSDVNAEALGQLARQSGVPDLVFHLAGGSAVSASLSAPYEDFTRTTNTTAALLDWLRTHSPRSRLVVASSAAVYGDTGGVAADESRPPAPVSPYGFHKLMMELLCQEYARVFGLETAILRMFSVYGEGLRKQLLWDCGAKLMQARDSIELGGSGEELRDWIHVEDAAHMLGQMAALASVECPIFNGGSGNALKVREVVAMLSESLGRRVKIGFSGVRRPGDPIVLVADGRRAAQAGLSCQISAKIGIQRYADWFLASRA